MPSEFDMQVGARTLAQEARNQPVNRAGKCRIWRQINMQSDTLMPALMGLKMKQIQLSNGGVALVDDEDFDGVATFKWFRHALGYAYRPIRKKGKAVGGIYLHRAIMGSPKSPIDHINRDKLDNRKSNLRKVEHFQNLHNVGLRAHNTSGFKGVDFDSNRDKWSARIKVKNRNFFLGRYHDKRDAMRARALAALWFSKKLGGLST